MTRMTPQHPSAVPAASDELNDAQSQLHLLEALLAGALALIEAHDQAISGPIAPALEHASELIGVADGSTRKAYGLLDNATVGPADHYDLGCSDDVFSALTTAHSAIVGALAMLRHADERDASEPLVQADLLLEHAETLAPRVRARIDDACCLFHEEQSRRREGIDPGAPSAEITPAEGIEAEARRHAAPVSHESERESRKSRANVLPPQISPPKSKANRARRPA